MTQVGRLNTKAPVPIRLLPQRRSFKRLGQRHLVAPVAGPGPLVDAEAGPPVTEAAPAPGAGGSPGVGVREARQLAVDLKAFKGRGTPRAVRNALLPVDAIHAAMRSLAQASAELGKRQLYLALHVRSETGQHSLRWRGYTASDGHRHLSWEQALERIEAQPYTVRQHLQAYDAKARELNELECQARAELRRIQAKASQEK